MRALAKARGDHHKEAQAIGREAEPYEDDAILQWINAAAPLAASTLITQLMSEDEDVAQRAAVKILEWSAGKPRAAKADTQDPRSRVLYEIVVPDKAESFEKWIEKVNAATPLPELDV